MQPTTTSQLLERFDTFLLDAYGVLVNSQVALPGAREFLHELETRGHRYMIVTNDASRAGASAARGYQARGLSIAAENVLTAGDMIAEALQNASPTKALRCLVLGPLETEAIVERAGHIVVPLDHAEVLGHGFDALVVADDSGFDFLPTMNKMITALHRAQLRGQRPLLLLANSDLMYPSGPQAFGYTSGAIAQLLEAGFTQLHPKLSPEERLRFDVLGKPSARIFTSALRRLGVKPSAGVAMLGDQLHTDVCGANRLGLTSVLVGTGITTLPLAEPHDPEYRPQLILAGLAKR